MGQPRWVKVKSAHSSETLDHLWVSHTRRACGHIQPFRTPGMGLRRWYLGTRRSLFWDRWKNLRQTCISGVIGASQTLRNSWWSSELHSLGRPEQESLWRLLRRWHVCFHGQIQKWRFDIYNTLDSTMSERFYQVSSDLYTLFGHDTQ